MKNFAYSVCQNMLLAIILLNWAGGSIAAAQLIDSRMTKQEAFEGLAAECPTKIRNKQKLIVVQYYSTDGKLHQGQLVLDRDLEKDIQTVFALARTTHFPIFSVIPISDPKFRKNGRWDDDISMAANNTSSFNYRLSVGTTHLSQHAYGRAIDINPVQNPYIKGTTTLPAAAKYDPAAPGTLTKNHPLVRAFLRLGWTWGGNWNSLKDYQHFEKSLPK